MKLNFVKEKVEKSLAIEITIHGSGSVEAQSLQDWLTMHNEIERYQKGLRVAVEEITKETGCWHMIGFVEGLKKAIVVIQTRFPELVEKEDE